MSVPTGSGVEAQARSSGATPSAVPDPCPGGDVPREGSRDIQQRGKIISVAYDWCNSEDSPVAYRIWAWQSSASNLANTVRQTDCRSHVLGSIVNECYGDEPGTGGGIKSGTNLAECTPMSASPTVRAEGRPMVRYLDKWHMNHGNTWGCLNNSEDTGNYSQPKLQTIDAKLSPIPSREEDQQALAKGVQMAGGAPAPLPPEPPPSPPAPAPSGGNVIPFPGGQPGPVFEAPSNPIKATNPVPGAIPSGNNFFRDFQPVQNDNGGYTYFTSLPAPLDKVYTFGQTGVEMAPGTQYFHINSEDGHPWLTADELNKRYLQTKREIRSRRARKIADSIQSEHQLRVTRNGFPIRCWDMSNFLKKRPESQHRDLITEACRQLKKQQDALNNLTKQEYDEGRKFYQDNGRTGSNTDFRNSAQTQFENDLMSYGYSRSDVASEATKIMAALAVTHEPDQFVGGSNSTANTLGLSSVNSFIGGGWKGRAGELDDYLNSMNYKPKDKLNIKLCIEVDGQQVC